MWHTTLVWLTMNYLIVCVMVYSFMIIDKYFSDSMNVSPKLLFIHPVATVVPAIGLAIDPERIWFYLICIFATLMGSVLRFGILHNNNQLSKRAVLLQFMITIPVCYIGYQIWSYYESSWPIHILLFFLSLFSIFIAGTIDVAGKIGIKEAVVQGLRYLAGKIDHKDIK